MNVRRLGDDLLVSLKRGDRLPDALIEAVNANRIDAAWIRGIGALSKVELGYFDIKKKEYLRRTFEGSYELVSLQGDLAWAEGNPIWHLHAAISGPDFALLGGHLFSAEVSVTGELLMHVMPTRIERTPDAWSGLKLWNL